MPIFPQEKSTHPGIMSRVERVEYVVLEDIVALSDIGAASVSEFITVANRKVKFNLEEKMYLYQEVKMHQQMHQLKVQPMTPCLDPRG